MKKLLPLRDQVVLEREKPPEKIGSIFVPEAAKEKPPEARVLAVGPGAIDDSGRRIEPAVKIGDTVLLAKWSGAEVELDGKKVIVVREGEILAIVQG